MIVVDSSVWIDFFNGVATAEVRRLRRSIQEDDILVGDIVLCEVLQGFRTERQARVARQLFASFPFAAMIGYDIAVKAAENYGHLRGLGITVRKTIDLLIGTFCIEHDHHLLHADRDYDPLAAHLGLQVVT
jgi:predicted nucleic acid-binding protein